MLVPGFVYHPDRRLRTKSEPVELFGKDLQHLAGVMKTVLRAQNGAGLAAIQVGVPTRVILVMLRDRFAFMVNPEITLSSDDRATRVEGCLSIPGVEGEVERATWVKVRYQGLDGREVETECAGMYAVCVQHEIDHLDGTLYLDLMSRVKRDVLERKSAKFLQQERRKLLVPLRRHAAM